MSRFVGRENEKAAVRQALEDGSRRLLTLTGPGGSGKTRLAIEVARDAEPHYPDGAWLVELGALADTGRIAQTAAAAFGLSDASERPILERLAEHIAGGRMLLVLDNCEHLIDGSARFAHALLADCANLQILATSREPLHIPGETIWPVPPLELPEWQPGQQLSVLEQSEAVQLFVERAGAVQPGFAITPENAQAVYQICAKLDGIPLALELAAARVSVLSMQEMADRIDSAFRWLESTNRLAPPRQRTLSAALDWSYHQLQSEEQVILRRLAVFQGGFRLDAAEYVCAGYGIAPEKVQALVFRLIDKSFVISEQAGKPLTRYRLLEVIRQYALDKLVRGGEAQAVRERHFQWCQKFIEQAAPGVVRSERVAWIDQIESELPNLRQALDWGLTEKMALGKAHHMVAQLAQFWQLRGYFREGMDWVQAALDSMHGLPEPDQAYMYQTAIFLSMHRIDEAHAMQYAEKAIALYRTLGDREGYAFTLVYKAIAHTIKKDMATARKLLMESLAIYQTLEPSFGKAAVLMNLGDIHFFEGNLPQAQDLYTESLAVSQQVGNELGNTRRKVRLAQVTLARGDMARAQEWLSESITACRGTNDRWVTAMILVTAAAQAWAQGRQAKAARCLGMAEAQLENFGARMWQVDQWLFEKYRSLLQESMDEAAFQTAYAEGCQQAADPEQALDFVSQGVPVVQAGQTGQPPAKKGSGSLSAREMEVASLIAQGMNNTQIAGALYVSVRTVETHITHILNKLNFTSRTQIAVWISGRNA